MQRKPRPRSLLLPLVAATAACAACRPDAGSTERPAPGKPPVAAQKPDDVDPNALAQLFDKVVRADVIFPDAAQRALYEKVDTKTIAGDRLYGFALKPQPGMQEDRHFHIITVAVARADKPGGGQTPGQTVGPNGGMWEEVVRTSDGRYELRLAEGTLLPDSVRVPDFDLHRVAQALSRRYDEVAVH